VAAASPLPVPRPPAQGVQRRWIVSLLVSQWVSVILELVIVGLLIALLVVLV
jgi:hypothetical protein